MNYLMVLPVPFYRVSDNEAATESAFHKHLRLLLGSLPEEVSRITIAAPLMDQDRYEERKGTLSTFNETNERIFFYPLEPASVGRLRYWMRHLLPSAVKIWQEVGRSGVVHSGPTHLFLPRDFLAIFFAFLRRKHSVFVVDIDWRRSAWMNWKTGTFSRKSYLLARYVYDPFYSLQVRLAPLICSLVLLKSEKLVRDYGRGKEHVKNFLDAAHSAHHIIPGDALSAKIHRQLKPGAPMKLVYFGRLTAYKGVEHMISAIKSLTDQGINDITLDVIGVGEDEQRLRALAADANLEGIVNFPGPIQFGLPLFEKLRGYDLLLAAPLDADTPRSALDAMASGVPILAYDTDYYVDLRNLSRAVEVVPWLDQRKLADAILQLHNDRESLAAMSNAAVKFATENTQEDWLERRAAWTRKYCFPEPA